MPKVTPIKKFRYQLDERLRIVSTGDFATVKNRGVNRFGDIIYQLKMDDGSSHFIPECNLEASWER